MWCGSIGFKYVTAHWNNYLLKSIEKIANKTDINIIIINLDLTQYQSLEDTLYHL